jgi:hypothetical protein
MRRPSHLLFAVLALVGSPPAATTPLGIHIHSDKAMFQVQTRRARSAPKILCCN